MILTLLLAAETPVAAPPARVSAQQLFDSATADAANGKCRDAVTTFRSIEGRVKNPAVLGAIRARMGSCLYRLQETDAARATLADALAKLPKDENSRGDRYEAFMTLGQIEYDALEHAASVRHFLAARDLATTPGERFSPQMWIARASMFENPDAAQDAATEAFKIAEATASLTKERKGEIRSVLGRVLLNRGKYAEAFAELRRSVTEQGGLTTKVTFGDVITRSDLALAALLSGKQDEAREYMAMTGAGRFKDTPFATARRLEPPPCGPETGLRPDDSAVVEFAIGPSGAVVGVQPVWASRPGPMAVAFARSVENWSWAPEDAAKIEAFFRAVTRVEIRCSNAAERPSLVAALGANLNDWMSAKGLKPATPNGSDAQRLATLRAELAAREAAGGGAQLVPVLIELLDSPIAELRDIAMWSKRAMDLAKAAGAPSAAWVAIALRGLFAGGQRSALTALLNDPGVRGDALATSALRVRIADLDGGDQSAAALASLKSVVDDTRLPDRHPLKIAALVRMADRQARSGDLDAARSSYTKTGLDDTQCALVGSAPDLKGYSAEFPPEAQRWGFEGWVRFETDVTASGRTTNQRAITVYPPFVFREAAMQMARSMRFSKTYRPSGDAACSAHQRTVRFRIGN